jgi:hypothetical protein
MSKTKKPQVNFKYQKSAGYRNYQIDGVFGGILPTTKIWFDPFIEKGCSPEEVLCELNNDGSVSEVKRIPAEKNNEVVRELQSGFVMDLGMAKTLREWLDDKISRIEAELKTKK